MPHLLKIVEESHPDQQLSALAALGETGTWDTLPALSKLALSPDRLVREAASEAVHKIARRHDVSGLSMGMSADYRQAVMLCATAVRVGTALFEDDA